jgi:hypothetical protein
MTQPSEEAIRKACEEAGVQWSPDWRKFWFTSESKLLEALARRIEAEAVPVAWIKPDWQNPEAYDGMSPVTVYPRSDWTPLYAAPPKEPTT